MQKFLSRLWSSCAFLLHLQLFCSEEIEMLVCGCPEFDMHALENVTVYDKYDKTDTTIRYYTKQILYLILIIIQHESCNNPKFLANLSVYNFLGYICPFVWRDQFEGIVQVHTVVKDSLSMHIPIIQSMETRLLPLVHVSFCSETSGKWYMDSAQNSKGGCCSLWPGATEYQWEGWVPCISRYPGFHFLAQLEPIRKYVFA